MDSQLRDKVVFVTGASGGIGRALAEAFAEEGARLALQGHRQLDSLRDFVAGHGWGGRARVIPADVTEPAELEAAMQGVVEDWGRIDVCVANAGIWPPEARLLHELSEERLREVVAINLFGATWTARAFMASLARTGPRPDGHGAALCFTGSTAGRFGERGHADYALSKAGLVGLVQTLKNEIVTLDPYGRVNMVQPGWTVTAMARPALEDDRNVRGAVRTMALRQLARADDIARAVVMLCSPGLSRHTSGEVLTVAGGMEGRTLWEEEALDVDAIRERLES